MGKIPLHHDYWISEFRKGNSLALNYVFDLHYRALCYFAECIIKDQQEAEDIAASSFIKIWKKHADFETAQNIKAFLFISTKNACFDYLKHFKRQSLAQKEYFKQLSEEEDHILNYLIEAEFLQLLNAEIEDLPEKCRAVFKFIYFDSLKTDEIAQRLALSVKTVRNHKARAVSLLQSALLKRNLLPILLLSLESIWNKLDL